MKRTVLAGISIAATVALTPVAGAQSFNIDFGGQAGEPPASYPGVASAGFWNMVEESGSGSSATVLRDLTGHLTKANLRVLNQCTADKFDNTPTTGSTKMLLEDHLSGGTDKFILIAMHGLVPGQYRVYTYAWAPPAPGLGTTIVLNDDETTEQNVSGPWPGEFLVGITHATHTLEIREGSLSIRFSGTGEASNGVVNGIQLLRVGPMAADLNADNSVNVLDLIELLDIYSLGHGCDGVGDGDGPGGAGDIAFGACLGDVNHDLQIDIFDIIAMLDAWTG